MSIIMPLVELTPAPTIYCTGLAIVDIIDTEVHCAFYRTARDGSDVSSQIVRAINLHMVMPLTAATAEALGLWAGASFLRPLRMDG